MLRFARSQFRFFFATSSCLGRKYPVVLIFELETYAGYPTQGVALMLIYEYPDTEEKKQNPKPYALNPSPLCWKLLDLGFGEFADKTGGASLL